MRAKMNYRLESVSGKSFLVTSYDAGEGKSLITSNLAIIAAQQHISTLLIDGDMRRGVLHDTFALDRQPGLSDLLLSEHQINEQMVRYSIKQTSFTNLFLLTSGLSIENPTELLTRPRFRGIIKWALSKFAMVIIDSPPLSPVTDSVIMNNLVSGSVLVVRAGKTDTAGLNKVIDEYPTFKEKIIGVVLNGVTNDDKRKKYNSYYYRGKGDPKPVKPLLLTSEIK